MKGRVYERFWAKVDLGGPVPEGFNEPCWLWTAATSAGYGRFGNWDDRERTQLAHRLSYEMFFGPIDAALTVDHLCDLPKCVNPTHFEIVTAGVNALRGHGRAAENVRKTHCPVGHELTGDNVYVYQNARGCRKCRLTQWHSWKARQRANCT